MRPENGRFRVEIVFIMTMVLWFLSAVSLIVLVLLHSGKGTGLSETFGGLQTSVGTGIIEKNLNRMTVVASGVFVSSLLILMLIWPNGSI